MNKSQQKLHNALLDAFCHDGLSRHVFEQVSVGQGHEAAYVWTIYDNIEDFCVKALALLNDQLKESCDTSMLDSMKIRHKIHYLVKARLDIANQHKEAFKSIYRYMMCPSHASVTASIAFKTADLIWRLAGDTSNDYNYYTKRGLLVGIMASTTLYWMSDTSDNHADSWDFLTRRIDNVLALGNVKRSMSDFFARKVA